MRIKFRVYFFIWVCFFCIFYSFLHWYQYWNCDKITICIFCLFPFCIAIHTCQPSYILVLVPGSVQAAYRTVNYVIQGMDRFILSWIDFWCTRSWLEVSLGGVQCTSPILLKLKCGSTIEFRQMMKTKQSRLSCTVFWRHLVGGCSSLSAPYRIVRLGNLLPLRKGSRRRKDLGKVEGGESGGMSFS